MKDTEFAELLKQLHFQIGVVCSGFHADIAWNFLLLRRELEITDYKYWR